jgi:SnoaL-like domain
MSDAPTFPTSPTGAAAPVGSLSLQEISDRLLIQDLLVEEAAAIDERDWDRWEAVYTPDAFVDWSGNSGAAGTPAVVRSWAEPVLSTENFPYPQYQHYCTNFRIVVRGDEATSRHLQIIPISVPAPGGGRQMAFSGIWFDDELVRTAQGWRIRARREQLTWNHNFPAAFVVPDGQGRGLAAP